MHAVELQERAYSTNQNIQPRPVKMIFRDDRPELDSRRYNVPQHDDFNFLTFKYDYIDLINTIKLILPNSIILLTSLIPCLKDRDFNVDL